MGMIGNQPAAGLIGGGSIQDGSVETIDLKDGAVTTPKVADGSVHTAKIADGAVSAAKLHTTAVTDKLGYTPLNKAGDTMTGNLDMGGKRVRDSSGTGKVYHNLTPNYDLYASGSTAGALVVDTAIPYNDSNMTAIQIAGYSYNTSHPWEINIGGYYGENNFYSMSAYSQGHPFGGFIYVARKTATNTISIILGSTSASYGTSIYVERFLQSYSNQSSSYADGWTISRITSTSNYSSVTQVPIITVPVTQFAADQTSMLRAHVPGGLSYGPYGSGGNYVLGWLQRDVSSGYTYAHVKTNLWGGGSPSGNVAYIMGGFRITGYIYSTDNIDDLIQFHNWSGVMAGLVRTCKASDVGNTAYVGSDGYCYLRLRSGSYAAYNVDLFQAPIYGTRDIRVVSVTNSNSATL